MKNFFSRFLALTLAIISILSLFVGVFAKESTADYDTPETVTVLFTHDLHSHLLPARADDGGEYGGYARLMYAIKKQREKFPDSLLLDGGDFSMGSLFQTAYADSAIELRIMGAMGYDATTLGNHEFDYLQDGLVSMLNAAVDSGDPLPAIVNANYLPPEKGEDGYNPLINAAFDNYGVRDYIIIERGGVHFAIFGIMGIDADSCAPNSGMVLHDAAETAQKTVDAAKKECLEKYGTEPVVICLSHGGTEKRKGEDFELAKNTNGIDLIISAHTHSTFSEVLTVGNTHIVSAAEYSKNLGLIQLEKTEDEGFAVKRYKLIPIDENTGEDEELAALVESYKDEVESNYLSHYGVSFDEILINNSVKFETVKEIKATQHEATACNVFSDAYKWAAEKASGETVDVALTAAGVIRESIPYGSVTTSDIFNAASLGVGTEGELVSVYITGKDLKNALEVDASVQPLMKSAQLYFSGVEYSYNTKRMIFNKVDYAMLRRDDGTLEEIDDEKLYRIVTGMYVGQMLGSVEETAMGLLTITPRDKSGNPIEPDRLGDYLIRDSEGNTVKEWFAIASYLQNMGGEMDQKYAAPDGRKVVYSSLNPAHLLSNANKFTYILIAVITVICAIIVVITILVIKKIKKKKMA